MSSMVRATGEPEEEPLPKLPPLDYDDDGDVEGPREDVAPELDELSALEGDESEEWGADELDVGIDLSQLDGDGPAEASTELVLDIGQLLTDTEDADPSDDSVGLPDFDESEGVQEPDLEPLGAEAEEGLEEPLEDLVDDELPGLDADSEGDFDDDEFGDLDIVDDERPPAAANPWQVREVDWEEHTQVVSIGMGIAALGPCLAFHRAGSTPRRVTLPARATVLAAADDSVLVATVTGKLFRARPDGHLDELETLHRDVVGERSYVVQAGTEADRVALLLDNGQLVTSQDGGASFVSCDNPRPVHAVASSGSLACDSEELIFPYMAARLPLPAAMARREASESLLVAHRGQIAVVATPALGVFLSRDECRSFQRIVGSHGVSSVMLDDSTLWIGVTGTAFHDPCVLAAELADGNCSTILELEGRRGEAVTGIARAEHDGRLWIASSAGLFVAELGTA